MEEDYEKCVDCVQTYFFEDMKCVFEEDEIDAADEGEVDNDVIDYDIFVLNERNLQKEIAKLLVLDAKEKPHVTSRKIDNMVRMYMNLHDQNFADVPPLVYMKEYFRPVVSIKRFIHQLGDKEKTKMSYVYDVTNYAYETIGSYVKLANRKPRQALAPFTRSGNENTIVPSTVDSIYLWDFDADKTMVEDVRLLDGDNVRLIGLVNTYGMPEADQPFSIGNVNAYYDRLKEAQQGTTVRIIPHDDRIGLVEEDAVIESASSELMTLRGEASGERHTLMLSTVASALSAPFCISFKDGKELFNKRAFFEGRYIAKFSDMEVVQSLKPSLEEWVFCHPRLKQGLYSIKEAEARLGTGVKNVGGRMLNVVAKNIARASRVERARKPFKFVRRVYRGKTWSQLLNVNAKAFKHYEKSSIDTAFHRMHFALRTGRMQTQLLKCIQEDLGRQEQQPMSEMSEMVDTDELPANDKAFNAMVKQELGKLTAWLAANAQHVFQTLDGVFYGELTNNGTRKFADADNTDVGTAYVWNPDARLFIAFKPVKRLGVRVWGVDHAESQRLVKEILGKDCEWDLMTCRIRKSEHSSIIHKMSWRDSARTMASQRPNDQLLAKNMERSKQVYDHDSYIRGRELTELNAREFVDLEGDEEYVDFERELNNREFGVQMVNLEENDAYEDGEDSDDEAERPAVGVATERGPGGRRTGVYDVITRIANLFSIVLTDDQITFVGQHTNLHTHCDQETAALRAFESQTHAEFARRGLKDEALDKVKKQLNDTRIAPKYAAIYDRAAYHITALLCVMIQATLPNVIIAPIPEHSKSYALEGFPLSPSTKEGAATLVGYLATLMVKRMAEMAEFRFLQSAVVSDVKERLTTTITNRILENTPGLVADLEAAKEVHKEFKQRHQHALDVIRSYSVWTTFRPYFDIKSVDYSGNNIAEITANYIALIQKIVDSAPAIKIGLDKKPLRLNSCCIEPITNNVSFWNFFLARPEVKAIVRKFERYSAGTGLSQLSGLSSLSVAQLLYDYVPDQSKEQFFGTMLNVAAGKVLTLFEVEAPSGSTVAAGRTLIGQTLSRFIAANPAFQDDNCLNRVIQLPNDPVSWSELSKDTFALLGKLSHVSGETEIQAVRDVLLGLDSEDKRGNAALASSIIGFLTYDLRAIFGKVSYNKPVDEEVGTNRRDLTKGDRADIEKAMQEYVPDKIWKMGWMDQEALKNAMSHACTHCLKEITMFHDILNAVDGDVVICYLLVYVMAKSLLILTARTYQTHTYNVTEVDFEVLSRQHGDNGSGALSDVIQSSFERLIHKNNSSISITRASDAYEKSREQGKQDIIKMMKNMEGDERAAMKELKERGLINLLDIARYAKGREGGLNAAAGAGVGADDGENVVDEGENEIVRQIANNRGENADDDDDNDDYYG